MTRDVFIASVEEAIEHCESRASACEVALMRMRDDGTVYAKALRDLASAHRDAAETYRRHRRTYR